jgi:hypothetical protein
VSWEGNPWLVLPNDSQSLFFLLLLLLYLFQTIAFFDSNLLLQLHVLANASYVIDISAIYMFTLKLHILEINLP